MLSYIENNIYFLSMNMLIDGDCEIRLSRKISEYNGERVYTHLCSKRTEKQDFELYRSLEKMILNNTLTEEYIKTLK